MDPASISQSIVATFAGVAVAETADDRFFFAAAVGELPPDRRLPFATLVTSDQYDDFSHLDRPGVFRLNLGVGRETFRALFGAAPTGKHDAGRYDYIALDTIMPHPVYGRMFWLCVLNPSAATWQRVQPLLAEAYQRAAQRQGTWRPPR